MEIGQEIKKHLDWIETVVALIDKQNVSDDELHAITQHDRCDLGQWLNSEGAARFADFPEMQPLKDSHEEFHKLAGDLVSALDAGDDARAIEAQHDFVERSKDVITYLYALRERIARQ